MRTERLVTGAVEVESAGEGEREEGRRGRVFMVC